MATQCQGVNPKTGQKCGAHMRRCKKCGAIGCRGPATWTCPNQVIAPNARCKVCGYHLFASM